MLKIDRSRSAIFIVTLLFSGFCKAQEPLSGQTPKRWGYEVDFQPGRVLVLDKYQKSYMRNKSDYSIGFKLNHATLPNDSDSYAHDYHYPTISLESRFSKNDGATMYRTTDYPSGNITPSRNDNELTKQVLQACNTMRIYMADHVIITDGNYYSYREQGKL